MDDRRDLNPKLKEVVRMVREISRIYKIKMPEVGVYPSQEINAFATGPAGNTLIAFSTNLINTMSLSEIRGVVGHELSHLIHYDIARILVVQGIFDVLHFLLRVLIASWLFQPSEEERETGELNIVKFIFKLIFFEILSAIMRRELAADRRGAEIVGIDDMLAALRKLLELENRIMFTITIKIPNLTEKAEKFLEKEFAKLEKIFKKPRELLFEEALIRKHEVKENTKKNRDEWHKEEIKREQYNSYIVEALFEFLEDMEDLKDVEKIE
ncbi:810_t:CDS:2 [Racocetra fulgida]|uniref:810_t:CDS:1 n=1 Tax=Racocetra fulgida TaxID=60492 RepID=A0A9N8VF20_9GLOM|nr:810_t:CDS:2 [Racocetra fulgida]